jgi:hypothetical protein
MFVRDSGNTPREISRIFVRDSSGNPQEISKIYVRDGSGNPILVFDNTTVVVPDLCPSCTAGSVYYFTVGGSGSSNTILTMSFGASYASYPQIDSTTQGGTFTPSINIQKDYWSKISTKYDILKTNSGNLETQTTYYNTLEQNLNTSFCQWCIQDFPTNSTFPQVLAEALLGTVFGGQPITGYGNLNNYPILPGYIIVDYKTNNKRSTVFSIMNMPQIQWTTHGVNYTNPETSEVLVPFGAYDSRFAPSTVAATRSSTIYPFYDRPVLLNVPDLQPGGQGFSHNSLCGQEYCGGIFTQEFFERWAFGSCWNWGSGGSQRFFESIIPSGINIDPCITGDVFLPPNGSTFPTVNNGTGDDCRLFIGGYDQTDWEGINPYSWILYYENGATGNTIPEVLSSAKPQDCCTSCFYGPVESSTPNTNDMCRHIYQIPPINSLTPPSTKLDFFDSIGTGAVLGPEIQGSSSSAVIRYTLPAYVTLDPALKSKIVKMFAVNSSNSNIDSFINAGPDLFGDDSGSTLTTEELSVWRAISGFMGLNIKNGLPLENFERVYLSSSSFYYEENRFDANPSGPAPQLQFYPAAPIGISTITGSASLGQYPLIWWSMSGYPTEQSTHYIVLELEFNAESCATSIANKNDAMRLGNLRKILKGIQFYPVQFSCKNMIGVKYQTNIANPSEVDAIRHFSHPAYAELVIDSTVQNGIDVVTGTNVNGCGFVDILWSNQLIPVDQGGTGVVTSTTSSSQQTREQKTILYNYKAIFTSVPQARYTFMRLKLPSMTYEKFLTKYYKPQTTIS